MNMTNDQAKAVSRLPDPYLKNHNGIIAAMVIDPVSDEVTRFIIHPDGSYHTELLIAGDRVWTTTYSTLGRDIDGSWLETNTLEATYYDRLTIRELIEHLLRIPEDQRHLPIYAFNESTGNVPLMAPTLFDEDHAHSMDNPLSMTLDHRKA